MAASETEAPERHAPRPSWPTRIVQPRTAQRCARHRHVDAFARCDRCQMQWCEACVQKRGEFGALFWVCSCGGRAARLPEPQLEEAGATAGWLGAALRAPLEGAALRLLLVGTLCYGLLDWWIGGETRAALGAMFRSVTAPIGGPLQAQPGYPSLLLSATGIVLFLCVLGYQFAWFLQVIRDRAMGRPAFESYPEFTSFVDSVMRPAGQGFAAFAATLGPGLMVMTAGPLPPWIGGAIACAGLVVLPMALASIALDGSLRGLDPLRIAQGVRTCGPEYAVAAALFVAMSATIATGTLLFDALGFVGPFARAFVILVSTAMAASALGRLLARHDPQLRWLARPPT